MSSLARNTLDLAINRFCPPVFGFLLIVIVGKQSTVLLGWYTVVTVYFFVFQTLPFLGLTPYIVKEAALRPSDAGRLYGSVVAISTAGIALMCMGQFVVFRFVAFPADVVTSIWIALLTAFPYVIAYTAELMYVASERTRLLGIVPVIENTARLGLSLAALRRGYGLEALFAIMLAGRIFAAAAYAGGLGRIVLRGQAIRIDRATARGLLKASPVFALNTLMFVTLSRVGFLVLSWSVGPVPIAHFSIGYRWLDLATVGLSAFAGAAYPMLSRARATTAAEFTRLSIGLIKLAGVAALILGLCGFFGAEMFVRSLFPQQYPDAVPLMRVLVWGIPLAGLRVVTQAVLFSASRPGLDLTGLTVGALLYVVLLAWWVPLYGAYGAAWALLTQSGLEILLRFWLVRQVIADPKDLVSAGIGSVAVSAGCVAAIAGLDILVASPEGKLAAAAGLALAYVFVLLRTGAVSRDDLVFLGLPGWSRRLGLR